MAARLSPVALAALLAASACNDDISITNIGNGVPPGACFLDVPPPGSIPTDPQCGALPDVPDPWSIQSEWTFQGGGDEGTRNASYTPPLVARLIDSNEDGLLDETDHPNIAMVAFDVASFNTTREGSLVVVDGVTHEIVLEVEGVYYATGHAIGDVNGDGWPDVVIFDAGRRAIALDRFGNMIWRTVASTDSIYPQATIADLDGDGIAEVIADNLIVDGVTGEVRATLIARSGIPYTAPVVGDINVDGLQEIVYGNTVFAHDGTPLWNTNIQGNYGHFNAILNADDDIEGEVMMVGASRLMFFDTDGTPLFTNELPRQAGSAPCIADFDGDGQSEIAFALTDGNDLRPAMLRAYEIDGELMWSRNVNDASGISGCSGYDFDGDRIVEVLYADETDLYILDGATGDIRYQSSDHASGTVYEYPIVADVDMDGAAEVLTVRSEATDVPLLSVLGHAGTGWAPTSSVWPLHDYAVTNVRPDSTTPPAAPLYWVEHNTFRARPTIDANPVDWQVSVVDTCVESCQDTGVVRIGVQVHNQGPAIVPAGTGVTLWVDNGTTSRAVLTHTLGTALPGRVYNLVLETDLATAREGELFVRVDDVGTGAGIWPECFEDNNVASVGAVQCE